MWRTERLASYRPTAALLLNGDRDTTKNCSVLELLLPANISFIVSCGTFFPASTSACAKKRAKNVIKNEYFFRRFSLIYRLV